MIINMYDQHEDTQTRFVGFVGNHRWDLAITTTAHFYGKTMVMNIQTGRSAILDREDLEETEEKMYLLGQQFGMTDPEQIEELAEFLRSNLPK